MVLNSKTFESELKMLQVIKQIKDSSKMQVKSTFLGAHAYPNEFKGNKDGYINLVLNKMLPAFKRENLIDYIDVFCEKGYFSPEDTERIIKEGLKYNIRSKIHVNQFNVLGGIKIAVENNALSVDHLEVLQDDDIKILSKGSTIPVVLPTCSYFLGIDYAPARKLIDAGLPLAIASDFNPGSSPSGNMNFVISTACTKMKLTTEEAINAATINGAYAMGLEDKVGSISKDKIANLIITNKINSIDEVPYNFGGNQIHKVILEGEIISLKSKITDLKNDSIQNGGSLIALQNKYKLLSESYDVLTSKNSRQMAEKAKETKKLLEEFEQVQSDLFGILLSNSLIF